MPRSRLQTYPRSGPREHQPARKPTAIVQAAGGIGVVLWVSGRAKDLSSDNKGYSHLRAEDRSAITVELRQRSIGSDK